MLKNEALRNSELRAGDGLPLCMRQPARGFTLIELAVALVVVALVLSSILVPLQAQVEQRKIGDTQKTLEDIKEMLLGFAIANGRLPCPASNTSNGLESFVGLVGASACTNPYNGFVPAATLGFPLTDNQGYAIDGWGSRVRYAVTTATNIPQGVATPTFTTTNGMRTAGIVNLAPDLHVCATSSVITATNCGTATDLTGSTKWAPAVIYSLGPNWATGGTGADEAANPNPNSANNDQVFVFHTRTSSNAANGEFDDIVTWLSANLIYSRMISAGQLP